MLNNCTEGKDVMTILRNTGYMMLLAASVSSIFALAVLEVPSPADARSDYCKDNPDDPDCSGKTQDKRLKCFEQVEKDGELTPEEIEKCDKISGF